MSDWTLYGTISHPSHGSVYAVWHQDGVYQVTPGEFPSSGGGYGNVESILKLKGLRPQDLVPAIGNGFGSDPSARRIEGAEWELRTWSDMVPVLRDSRFICESVEDNDIERWRLSLGGQFIRETGQEGGRFYIVPANEARDMLASLGLEDHVMALLDEANAFGTAPAPSA